MFSNASAASTGNDSTDDASVLNTRHVLLLPAGRSPGTARSIYPWARHRRWRHAPHIHRLSQICLHVAHTAQGSPSAQSTARGFISSFAGPALQFSVDDDDHVQNDMACCIANPVQANTTLSAVSPEAAADARIDWAALRCVTLKIGVWFTLVARQ